MLEEKEVDDWITVHTLPQLLDAQLLKAKMELEGIEVQLLDELSVTLVPTYPYAIGGVRIQVRMSQRQLALDFLIREGYLVPEVRKTNKLFAWINQITLKVPFVKRMRWELRFLIFTSFLVLVLMLPLVICGIPTNRSLLVENSWCIDSITYRGKPLKLDVSHGFVYFSNCRASLRFEGQKVHLPEYVNVLRPESWNEYKGGIYIHSANPFGDTTKIDVFEGAYQLTIDRSHLELKSNTTIIRCSRLVM